MWKVEVKNIGHNFWMFLCVCLCVTYVELNESFLWTMANDNVYSENVKIFCDGFLEEYLIN